MSLTVNGGSVKIENDRSKLLILAGVELVIKLTVAFASVRLADFVVPWDVH